MRWGWTSGLGGVGGRGRASTQVGGYKSSDKQTDFEFFWGREGGGPWSGATEARDGLDFGLGIDFFWGREGGSLVGGEQRDRGEGVEWVQGSGAREECRARAEGGGAVEGKHARSVFVGWRANPTKVFWGREGGSLVGGDRGGSWGGS